MLCVLDIDGVIWLGGQPIEGSAGAVAGLRSAGHQIAVVTNNSAMTVGQYVQALAKAGVEISPEELVSSSQAAASLVEPGSSVAYMGGPGIGEALEARGASITAASEAEVVIVGRSVDFDYRQLAEVSSAIRNGARYIATNADPTYPTTAGPQPGAGALVAFVSTAAGRSPEIAGKPHQPVADLVTNRFGSAAVMVGDRADTDGLFARRLKALFALVMSGSTSRSDLPVDPAPDLISDDLAGIVEVLLSSSGS